MKTLLIFASIFILILGAITIVPASYASNLGTSICEYVQSDNKKRLRAFLKQNKLKIRSVFGELRCNQKNLLEFAVSSGSLKTGKLIISKLPKNDVSANIDFLKAESPELFEVANKRIGG